MAQILLGVCHGVEAIHQKGYLHNDLKCDNVVLSDCVPYMEKAPKVWPVIIDFGKAKPLSSPKCYRLNQAEMEKYLHTLSTRTHKRNTPSVSPNRRVFTWT